MKCRVNKLKELLRTQGGTLFLLTAGPKLHNNARGGFPGAIRYPSAKTLADSLSIEWNSIRLCGPTRGGGGGGGYRSRGWLGGVSRCHSINRLKKLWLLHLENLIRQLYFLFRI